MSDVLVVRVASMVGPTGSPGSGTILEGDGILATEVGDDVEVAVDFGAGLGKVLEATQDAIEAALAVALAADGPVVALDGELVSRPLVAADLAAGGTDGQVLTKSGTGQAWSTVSGGGSGDTVAQGTGILITGTSPKTIAADFGSGAGKVQTATKAALEATLALGSGLLTSAANVLGLATKADLESLLALGSGLVKSTANALGLATKADIEALLASGTGVVKASSNTLSAVTTLLPGDLATIGSPLDRLRIAAGGTTMEWVAPVNVDVNTSGVVTGLSSGTEIPVTTGFSYGALSASAGFHRIPHNTVWAVGRNSADTGDHSLISWGTSANTLTLGSSAVNGMVTLVANGGTFSMQTSSATCNVSTAHQWNLGAVQKVRFETTAMTLGATAATAFNVQWNTGVTSPTITQSAKSTDAAPATMSIAPQAPFATATGANRVPGSCAVTIGSPTNAGTTHGSFSVSIAAANILVVDKDTSGVGRIAVTVQTASSATAGGASALPATPTGYKYETINGVVSKIPYYTV